MRNSRLDRILYIQQVLVQGGVLNKQQMDFHLKLYPVRIALPVNLRRFFPSKTLRNFISMVYPSIDPRLGNYTFEEIVAIAKDVVENVGLDRCFLIPRFMQVLLKTDYKERRAFIDAAIAIDDLKMLQEFERQNNRAARYILFGQKSRCDLYESLISQMYAGRVQITKLSDKEILSELTVKGAIKIANEYTKTRA